MASNPPNISANVGQVGGVPLTPADVTSYLSQLGGSLNGFAGNVANVLNYLLVQGVFITKTVRVGILGQSFSPIYATTNGQLCGMAAGGVGSVFTPASTGRIFVVALVNGTLNFPQAASTTGELNAHLWMGKGTTGPAFGTTYPLSTGPVGSKQIGGGLSFFWEQGTAGGYGTQQSGIIGGTTSGLTQQQSYWIDLGVSTTGSAASGGTVLVPTSVVIVEY